jgi:hypothetical protein
LQLPVPSHALPFTHTFCGTVSTSPAGTFVHVPSDVASPHVRHGSVHASLQHTPSMQFPLTQSAALPHGCASSFLHTPAPSHACGAPHVPGSAARAGTLLHVPSCPVTRHDTHTPSHAVSQHTPSTQYPDTHSVAPPHSVPAVFLHAPAPSHAVGAAQVSSCAHFATKLHVPRLAGRLHARHSPVHAVSQHTPSAQEPLTHSPLPPQPCA